ncbi:MAG: hypothetical protein JWN95_2313 [Frankiales bacterium]|nr:hypothetical protein [Frankiales bacterium]
MLERRPQRLFEQVQVGDELADVRFPLSAYRLVMAAGSNRDFNSIHTNDGYARRMGAPGMFANNVLLQGMWERTVRDFIGSAGTIRALRGFRMRAMNLATDTVTVSGRVTARELDGPVGVLSIEMTSRNEQGVTVGPGLVLATLPVEAACAGPAT